jgi:cellulose synthase/poly-beta-1,6-N-acetylglucosamine synthase-like glycosyltransferase
MIGDILNVVAAVTLIYFIVLNGMYIIFTGVAWKELTHHLRARRYLPLEEVFASPLTPGVSVLLPAFNEEAGIVDSVRSLLALRYPRFEIIVVNDGSTDRTLAALTDAFDLAPIRKAMRSAIPTARVEGAYASRVHPRLTVIDKRNGGKADALNAGANAARLPYLCAVDADSLIESGALLQVAAPIVDDPELTVATGGIVRIANGCTVDHGRVTQVGLPDNGLATLQVIEYLRAFLVGRVGWSRLNSLLIVSGAFGLFRRSLVEEVGGWWTETVGEDMELVVRLHRHLRSAGIPYRISFIPDPVCWTEVPEKIRGLEQQRRRWHRGMGEALWRHRAIALRPRYGVLGMVAYPYFFLLELLGPVIGFIGVPVTILWWLLGGLSLMWFVGFAVVAFLVGSLLSVAALALEEFNFRRLGRRRDVARLVIYSALESIGYRQLNDWWRTMGVFDLLRRRKGWGVQERRGFQAEAPAPSDTALPPARAKGVV